MACDKSIKWLNWDFADQEVFVVEQGQCGVTELRVLPLPAVVLQEERWVFLELVQFSECVFQSEGQAVSLVGQGIVGVIEGQTRIGVRERGARRGVVRGRPSTSLGHDALTGARRNITTWDEDRLCLFLKLFEFVKLINR